MILQLAGTRHLERQPQEYPIQQTLDLQANPALRDMVFGILALANQIFDLEALLYDWAVLSHYSDFLCDLYLVLESGETGVRVRIKHQPRGLETSTREV